MHTALIAQRLRDPQIRKIFVHVHKNYRDICDNDLHGNCVLCTHSLVSLDASSLLPEIRRVVDLVKTGQTHRLTYVEFDGEPMRCFWNVSNVVELEGGRMRTGWLVSAFNGWTGLDLCWHAVWESPVGDMIEVTPGYQRCQFVPSEIFPPTSFVARTFLSIEDMGVCAASKIVLNRGSRELRDEAYMIQSGLSVNAADAIERAKLRLLRQAVVPRKSPFKRRKRR